MKLINTLNQSKLKELEKFLLSDKTPSNCMNLNRLHGFLTGLAIGPETVLPSVWLPEIWGKTADDELIWETNEQAERIFGLIISYFNSVVDMFINQPSFSSLLPSDLIDGDKIQDIENWCSGFMLAVDRTYDSWKPLFDSDLKIMGIILLFGTDGGFQELKDSEDPSPYGFREYAITVLRSVTDINRYWLPYRKEIFQSTQQVLSPKVGRNDPCSCGSGKKFKNCCMN